LVSRKVSRYQAVNVRRQTPTGTSQRYREVSKVTLGGIMGGEISMKDIEKKIEAGERSKEIKVALESGISVGKDEARKLLEANLDLWEAEERVTLSHKLFVERIMKELRVLAESWKLKTVPWEEVKKELEQETDADRLAEGGS